MLLVLVYRRVSRLTAFFLCSDIEYFTPYPALSERISNHITYLDTIGRPKITLRYKELTDKHTGNIYVSIHHFVDTTDWLIARLLGHLQSAVPRAHAEAACSRDGLPRCLCARADVEACRYPHPAEVTCTFPVVAVQNNLSFSSGRSQTRVSIMQSI